MQTGTLSAAQENVRVCLRLAERSNGKYYNRSKEIESLRSLFSMEMRDSIVWFGTPERKQIFFFCIQRNVRKCPFEKRKKTAFSTNLSHAWGNPELNSIEWVGYEKLNAHFQFHSQMPILIPIPIPIHLVFRIWFCVCCVWVCVIMEPAKHRHTYINA